MYLQVAYVHNIYIVVGGAGGWGGEGTVCTLYLIDGCLHVGELVIELPSYVDVCRTGSHGTASNQTPCNRAEPHRNTS